LGRLSGGDFGYLWYLTSSDCSSLISFKSDYSLSFAITIADEFLETTADTNYDCGFYIISDNGYS
jgi:hypothetical protein